MTTDKAITNNPCFNPVVVRTLIRNKEVFEWFRSSKLEVWIWFRSIELLLFVYLRNCEFLLIHPSIYRILRLPKEESERQIQIVQKSHKFKQSEYFENMVETDLLDTHLNISILDTL